jgi:hypothetical protein
MIYLTDGLPDTIKANIGAAICPCTTHYKNTMGKNGASMGQ